MQPHGAQLAEAFRRRLRRLPREVRRCLPRCGYLLTSALPVAWETGKPVRVVAGQANLLQTRRATASRASWRGADRAPFHGAGA